MRRRALLAAVSSAPLMACAPQRRHQRVTATGFWSGRLSLLVRSEPQQSFSAGFELRGGADAGELRINSPLGNAVAQARWNTQEALLQAGQDIRRFDSLGALLETLTGAELPVTALFDWLAGQATPVAGWRTDLSRHAQGKLFARRLASPAIELRIVLDD